MTNVIGPISYEDWYTLRLLRSSISWYKSKRDSKFDKQIKKEEEVYNYLLKEIAA